MDLGDKSPDVDAEGSLLNKQSRTTSDKGCFSSVDPQLLNVTQGLRRPVACSYERGNEGSGTIRVVNVLAS